MWVEAICCSARASFASCVCCVDLWIGGGRAGLWERSLDALLALATRTHTLNTHSTPCCHRAPDVHACWVAHSPLLSRICSRTCTGYCITRCIRRDTGVGVAVLLYGFADIRFHREYKSRPTIYFSWLFIFDTVFICQTDYEWALLCRLCDKTNSYLQ